MRILYFAWVREAAGRPGDTLDIPETVKTVADLMSWLSEKDAGLRRAFENRDQIRAAVDQVFVTENHALAGASEVAFFPPVTGG